MARSLLVALEALLENDTDFALLIAAVFEKAFENRAKILEWVAVAYTELDVLSLS